MSDARYSVDQQQPRLLTFVGAPEYIGLHLDDGPITIRTNYSRFIKHGDAGPTALRGGPFQVVQDAFSRSASGVGRSRALASIARGHVGEHMAGRCIVAPPKQKKRLAVAGGPSFRVTKEQHPGAKQASLCPPCQNTTEHDVRNC